MIFKTISHELLRFSDLVLIVMYAKLCYKDYVKYIIPCIIDGKEKKVRLETTCAPIKSKYIYFYFLIRMKMKLLLDQYKLKLRCRGF